MARYGQKYCLQGRLIEAESLFTHLLPVSTGKKDLGSEHLETLNSLIILASVWKVSREMSNATDHCS